MDNKTNNLAMKAVKEALGGWSVAEADYRYLGKTEIIALRDGQPVKSASVTLKIGDQTFNHLVSGAKVEVYGLPPGKIVASATYLSGGQTKPSTTMTYDTPLKRPMPLVAIGFALPDADIAEKAPEAPTAKKGEPNQTVKPQAEAKPVVDQRGSNPLTWLISLGIAGAIIFALLKFLPQYKDKLNDQLAKVGVAIPDIPDAQHEPDPTPAAPIHQKVEPILLDQTAPIQPSGEWQLVGVNGKYAIPEGTSTLGREGTIAFPTESTMSRQHAEFTRSGTVVQLKDLGSSNGTWVNGQRLAGDPITLNPGDNIQMGATVFRIEG